MTPRIAPLPAILLPILLSAGACAPAAPANAQRMTETKPMSDSTAPAALAADVQKALAEYDTTRAAPALQAAADALVRDDGAVPADPAQAQALGRMELRLWLEIFARFQRDLEPGFDPAHPPPTSVAPPEIDGAQMMPGTRPADIKDPVIRAAYEAKIAENARRVQNFTVMVRLHAIRLPMLDRAVESLRNARDILGIPAAEIVAAIQGSAIAAADKDALAAGIAQ